MIEERMPVFVCRCCGNIIRAVAFEECDIYKCRICDFEMIKTKYSLSDSEYDDIYSDSRKSFDFRSDIFSEYVQGNQFYDNLMHKKRLDEENKHFEKWVYG